MLPRLHLVRQRLRRLKISKFKILLRLTGLLPWKHPFLLMMMNDDDMNDMNDGATATDAHAQSAASTAACERITMMAPPVKTQARRFFRPSVVASNASSTMDYEAEDMTSRIFWCTSRSRSMPATAKNFAASTSSSWRS